MDSGGSRAFVVAAAGGEPRRIGQDLASAWAPIWNADSTHVLLLGNRERGAEPDWWMTPDGGGASVSTGATKAIHDHGLAASPDSYVTPDAWMPDGHVLFSARLGDSTNIWRLDVRPGWHGGRIAGSRDVGGWRRDAARRRCGPATRVHDADEQHRSVEPHADTSAGTASGQAVRLSDDGAIDAYPSLTPDGRTLLFMSNRTGSYDMWRRDTATGKERSSRRASSFRRSPSLRRMVCACSSDPPTTILLSLPLTGVSAASASAGEPHV
jgi:hypothetical protein